MRKQLDMFEDVVEFQKKFNIPMRKTLGWPSKEMIEFRIRFIKEEICELEDAIHRQNIVESFDALIDLVYVTLGFASILSLPWQKGWDLVHKSNMKKERVRNKSESIRKSEYDVIKPNGWQKPDLLRLLRDYDRE